MPTLFTQYITAPPVTTWPTSVAPTTHTQGGLKKSVESYNFESLLPHFKKSTTFTPAANIIRAPNASVGYDPTAFCAPGEGGPVHVSYPNWANPFSSWVKRGFEQLGLKVVTDLVSGSLLGMQYPMNTLNPHDETRSSSETAYLRLALSTTDLKVHKDTLAKRIMFDDKKKATGVLVDTRGFTYMLEAKQEVILSAGVVNLPLPFARNCSSTDEAR